MNRARLDKARKIMISNGLRLSAKAVNPRRRAHRQPTPPAAVSGCNELELGRIIYVDQRIYVD